LRAGERLKANGATAIAVVARFPDDQGSDALQAYRHGSGVDALAGAEAVISHLLVRHLEIPCAHAPALSALPLDPQLDPRAAGEELGYTFLACVLVGLSQAPELVQRSAANIRDLVADDLGVLVVPEGSLGGEAALACLERKVPVICVTNPSLLQVTSTVLGLGSEVSQASSYAEAAGMVLALREGVSLSALMRPLPALKEME
jgi:hypothetical protein